MPKSGKLFTPKRKQRTRSHIIADLSVNYVERFVLLNGDSCVSITKDYGYDLNVHTHNENGECENGYICVQLKATDTLKLVNNKSEIAFKLDRKDIDNWIGEPFPVVLIIYDATRNEAYWIIVQKYFKAIKGFNVGTITDSYTVRIPITNVLNKHSFESFKKIKNDILCGQTRL